MWNLDPEKVKLELNVLKRGVWVAQPVESLNLDFGSFSSGRKPRVVGSSPISGTWELLEILSLSGPPPAHSLLSQNKV